MDKIIKKNTLNLTGVFIETLYEGDISHTFLFRDSNFGWYAIASKKENPEYKLIKFNEECKVQAQLKGKLKDTFNGEKCFNEIYLQSYTKKNKINNSF